MKDPSKLIAVVDDDESVREALPDLLREFGFDAIVFDAAEAFLSSGALERISCLILDIAMPGMTGPELQRELLNQGRRIPLIFITAHADANVRAGLLQNGAVDCLFKPFGDQDLRAALDRALAGS
jgi:FixJ family two-component response regulator